MNLSKKSNKREMKIFKKLITSDTSVFFPSECPTSKDSLAVARRKKKKRFLKTTAPRWMKSSSASGINFVMLNHDKREI